MNSRGYGPTTKTRTIPSAPAAANRWPSAVKPNESELSINSSLMPAMQYQAAQMLDQLLVPIEVSGEIKKLSEKQSTYAASVPKGAQMGN